MKNLFYLKQSLKVVVFVSLVASFFVLYNYLKPADPCKRCNVILISLDTLSADHLPCYGYYRNTAPGLCAFAKDHTLFTNAYTQSSYTLSSHYSIFTSLYPSSHGVLRAYKDALSPSAKTVTEALQLYGYDTVFVGPTEDVNLPLDKGLGRGFNLVYNGDIEDWDKGLTVLLSNTKKGKPTFLFLHSYKVHDPYFVDTTKQRLYSKGNYPNIPLSEMEYRRFTREFLTGVLKDLKSRIDAGGDHSSVTDLRAYHDALLSKKTLGGAKTFFDTLPEYEQRSYYRDRYFRSVDLSDQTQIDFFRGLYDERVTYQDQLLTDKFFSFLSNNKLLDNSIIIITADHGEEFAEHGGFDHARNVYNSSTHVPLLVAAPGTKLKTSGALIQSIDIYPTILGLLGLGAPTKIEGLNYGNLLFNKASGKNTYLFSEQGAWSSIRDQNWKLYNKKGGNMELWELYNIITDPQEKNNVLKKNPSIVNRLMIDLRQHNNRRRPEVLEKQFHEWIDPKKREGLTQEGYF